MLIKHFFLIISFFWSCTSSSDYEWTQTTDNDLYIRIQNNEHEYHWDGDSYGNVIHGEGTLTSYNKGQVVFKKKYTGKNSVFYGAIDKVDKHEVNDGFYVGDIKENKFDGFGVYVKNNGEVYIGYFTNGMPNGKLSKYKYKRLVYEGEWVNGKRHGLGTYFQEDGTIKKGVWLNGKLKENAKQ